MIRRPLGSALGSALVVLAVLTFIPNAHAVPSYSRQTGMPCVSWHYAPPELTPFGRTFKLEGYTFTTKPEVRVHGLLPIQWRQSTIAGRDASANNTVYLLARFVF